MSPDRPGIFVALRTVGLVSVIVCLWVKPFVAAAEWEAGTGYRSKALEVPVTGKAGFTRLSGAATGVTFTNVLTRERYTTNQTFLNGSGVALGDVDGDGQCDIFLCSLDASCALYRNL